MRIGVDLGGSKIEVAVLADNGDFYYRHRLPTPRGNYRDTLATVVTLIALARKEIATCPDQNTAASAIPVGIGLPGAISHRTGRVKNANSTCLIGEDLQGDLQALLGHSIQLANDADCFTLSEAVDGAGHGCHVVMGVILGTGVGGGIAVGRQLLQGPNRITGEWGHNGLPRMQPGEHPGPPCYCGRSGCIETFLSGPGLALDHWKNTGERIDAREVVRRAEAGDTKSTATMARYEERLARGLAEVINILDPDVIVLGGGLSNVDRLYANVPQLLQHHVFTDHVETPLVKARFGDSSGVRGAAWLGSK
ncbi:MAG: ROK family protein [Magnetococcales bacterium]|nr:ROK family protein [Magnetococcales bacterium]